MATKTRGAGKFGDRTQDVNERLEPASAESAAQNVATSPKRRAIAKDKPDVPGRIDRAYLALIRRFPLRPLRHDAELDAAAAIIDDLTDRDDLSPSESDYLDVLGDLVEKYEDEYVKMPHVSDSAMLRSLMEEKGVRQAEVVRGTGISKTVVSLVLNGKRDLTREHITALSKYFAVDPSAFLGLR